MRPRRVGVIGLARSGRSAAELALASGSAVFATDAGDTAGVRAAASEIRRLGGEAETGGHTVERLAECDLIVVSPGVPPDAAIVNDRRLAGIPWTSELEFASRHLDVPLIAVTGTNGKTTVTAWIAHLLNEAGVGAVAAGNIGTPLSDVALRSSPPEWVVVEASSYQLGRIDTFAPQVGVVTNLAPGHLDRYPDVASYYADKAHIFDNSGPHSTWILNAEDDAVLGLARGATGRRLFFRFRSRPEPEENGGWVGGDDRLLLRVGGEDIPLVEASELQLLGAHNRANALASALAAHAATGAVDALRQGLRSFSPLRHRLEPVVEVQGVLWVNDSKATNVASARVAIESMDRPTVLLLGGRHKGEDYGGLANALERHVRAVVAYGEAADRIERDLGDRVRVVKEPGSFRNVVSRAHELAEHGDAVLLAPACASFDMFRDYEDRGNQFATLVGEVTERVLEANSG